MNPVVLIFFATHREMKSILQECLFRNYYGKFIYQCEFNNFHIHAVITGIGPKNIPKRIKKYRELFSYLPVSVLILGLSGGLDDKLKTGDVVNVCKSLSVYEPDQIYAINKKSIFSCAIDELIQKGTIINGSCLSSDKVLETSGKKEESYKKYKCSIVDMETAFILKEIGDIETPVTVLRVVSDTARDTLPETAVIWGHGNLFKIFTTLIKELMNLKRCIALIELNRKVKKSFKSLRRVMGCCLNSNVVIVI